MFVFQLADVSLELNTVSLVQLTTAVMMGERTWSRSGVHRARDSGILLRLVDSLTFLSESSQTDLLAQLMKTEEMVGRFPGRCDEETARAVLTVRNAVASSLQIQKLGDILSSPAN